MPRNRRQPTEAQKAKAEKRRAAFRELANKVGAMNEAERLEFLKQFDAVTTIEGHTLSVGNMMLTLMQEPRATIVGGFNQWKAAGRYVRKGESGIGIWAPGKAKDAVDDQDIRFFMITVFDVSQTELIEAEAA